MTRNTRQIEEIVCRHLGNKVIEGGPLEGLSVQDPQDTPQGREKI
jgi:hypothetical protein